MAKDTSKDLFASDDSATAEGPVECLGMTFPNDAARRTYFMEKLEGKLKDPAFREIEGFPLGEDKDILAMSDPPYYTACPNPFFEDFVRHYSKVFSPSVVYRREPQAVDVSEGKTDAIYTAHGYHTKVPYKAIMRAILHFTEPGDLVLDGFAGSGMTGVAAQMCGCPDGEFKQVIEEEWKEAGFSKPQWGARRAVLNDLGPAASFIAANYNLPFDVSAFEKETRRILDELKQAFGWMFETLHTDGKSKGRINYTVWSEVFGCPECGKEVVFYQAAVNQESGKVSDPFFCPHCNATLTKDSVQRLMETTLDVATRQPHQRIRLIPVRVNYTVGRNTHQRALTEQDKETLRLVTEMPLPTTVPTDPFPIEQMYHGTRLQPKGFTSIHHLFFPRIAQFLGEMWRKVSAVPDRRLRNALHFWIDSHLVNLSIQNRYRPEVSFPYNPLTGVYYIASVISEANPFVAYENKAERMKKAFAPSYSTRNGGIVATGDCGSLYSLPDHSIDYIFTDPPFGENIFYADLSFQVEAWYRVKTNTSVEAIIDNCKDKGLYEYQHLMQRCFEEYHRVLKPGRWMTVVFHNSRNSVWNAIQEAILAARFMIADVRTLDKQQGSYRQVTSTAMKQDLVISAYKPDVALEERFNLQAGTEAGAWEFIRSHLAQLPVCVVKKGRLEVIAERLDNILFDRMVAFHVLRNKSVPLSASEFYAGLGQRFPMRDGMYFLEVQVAEFDKRKSRLAGQSVVQLDLFVKDERNRNDRSRVSRPRG